MTDNVERTLGRIEAMIGSVQDDIKSLKEDNRIEITKMQLVQDDLRKRMDKHETLFAKMLAIAGVFGAVGAVLAEWLWKKVSS